MPIVNVFLGGTGKFIAEEMKGNAAFWSQQLGRFLIFDLTTTSEHTGSFAVGGDLLHPAPGFPTFVKEKLAPEWEGLPMVRALAPSEERRRPSGPRLRPEASILKRIGHEQVTQEAPQEGLWGLRALGLAAWDAFLSSDTSPDAVVRRREFADALRDEISAKNANAVQGNPLRIHVIASTGGGTGAGISLPFVLWLRQQAWLPPGTEINLILVTASAFRRLPQDLAPDQQLALETKAESGTVAVIRELEFLRYVDPGGTAGRRKLPAGGGLSYRAGEQPVRFVFWQGCRSTTTDDRNDVYSELVPAVQILSTDEAMKQLGQLGDQIGYQGVLSTRSAGYPRLRIVMGAAADVVAAAVDGLLTGGAGVTHSFFDYGKSPWVRFLQSNRYGAFKDGATADVNADTLTLLVDEVELPDPKRPAGDAATRIAEIEAIDTLETRVHGEWTVLDDKERWNQFVTARSSDLKQRSFQVEGNLVPWANQSIASETARFSQYIEDEMPRLHLEVSEDFPQPRPLDHLRRDIAAIRGSGEFAGVQRYFAERSSWLRSDSVSEQLTSDALVLKIVKSDGESYESEMGNIRHKTTTSIDAMISATLNGLQEREPPTARAGLGERLSAIIAAGFAGLIVGFIVSLFVPSDLLWLGVCLVAGLGTAIIVHTLVSRMLRPDVEEARIRYVRKLDRILGRLYTERARAILLQSLFDQGKGSFAPGCADSLDSVTQGVEEAAQVLNRIRDGAGSRATAIRRQPKHELAVIGPPVQQQAQGAAQQYAPVILDAAEALRRKVRIVPQFRQLNGDFTIAIVTDDGTPKAEIRVSQAAATIAAAKIDPNIISDSLNEFRALDSAFEDEARKQLGSSLPLTLETAAKQYAAVRQDPNVLVADLLAALVNRTVTGAARTNAVRLQPSVTTGAGGMDAIYRALWVPDNTATLANTVLTQGNYLNALPAGDRETLAEYGQQVASHESAYLGGSMAVLEVSVPQGERPRWSPGSIGSVDEISSRAFWTYYGRANNQRDPANANFLSQKTRNFHIIPELASAADIELRDPGIPEPLHYAVIQRLTGSDPSTEGPRLLELFYLLRSTNILTLDVTYGYASGEEFVLKLGDRTVALERRDRNAAEADPLFGPGRAWIRRFDAFCDFMLYDGAQIGARAADDFSVTPSILNQWAALASERVLAALQQAVVNVWFEATHAKVAAEKTLALLELAKDVQAMDDSDASADWNRVVKCVIETGAVQRLNHARPD